MPNRVALENNHWFGPEDVAIARKFYLSANATLGRWRITFGHRNAINSALHRVGAGSVREVLARLAFGESP
jgi:hypothetical protein